MAKNFNDLRSRMSPERQARNAAEAQVTLLEMTLQELRQNITALSQGEIAEILQVTQGYISKLERQDDMLLSNLYAYVEALGGKLELTARFPGHPAVQITQFRDLEKLTTTLSPVPKKQTV